MRKTPPCRTLKSCAVSATWVAGPRRPGDGPPHESTGVCSGTQPLSRPQNPRILDTIRPACHEGLTQYAKLLAAAARKRAGSAPARADQHVAGPGVPWARHLGGSRRGAPRAKRGGGRSSRGGHGRSRRWRSRLRLWRPVAVPMANEAKRPGRGRRGRGGRDGHGRGVERPCRSRRGRGSRADHGGDEVRCAGP